MASNFPNSIDAFVNPQYTKVDGVDYVKAEHINDLQDALKNVQLLIIGSGVSMNIGSNNYLPITADIKSSLEILDGEVRLREDSFQSHIDAVMPTDLFQHHANVVEVTSIGNMSGDRLQWVLEDFQNNIDMIMSGGIVNAYTLDDRYILSGGPAEVTGTLQVNGDTALQSNVDLGSSISHTVTASGDLKVGRDIDVYGKANFRGDILIPDVSRIGASTNSEYTHLAFTADKVALKSFKDIEFQLDSDDAIDGTSMEAGFNVLNGSGDTVFSLMENGQLAVQTKVSTTILEGSSHLSIGASEKNRIEHNKMSVDSSDLVLQIDADNSSVNDYFAVTQDGDTGSLDSSEDLLLKVTDSKFIAGQHVLKRNVSEAGYFGIKFYSENAGGRHQGYGVNFKTRMMSIPSSIVLNVSTGKSENFGNLVVSDINEYGFFVECESLEVGNCEVKGTYETVGN